MDTVMSILMKELEDRGCHDLGDTTEHAAAPEAVVGALFNASGRGEGVESVETPVVDAKHVDELRDGLLRPARLVHGYLEEKAKGKTFAPPAPRTRCVVEEDIVEGMSGERLENPDMVDLRKTSVESMRPNTARAYERGPSMFQVFFTFQQKGKNGLISPS